MYYEDLTPYGYLMLSPAEELCFPYSAGVNRVVNVGWLDGEHPFPVGEVTPEVLDKICELCVNGINVTRGVYLCTLCCSNEPPECEWKGLHFRLGAAEIWVPGLNGIVYAAPDLIHHYIKDHSYCPPHDFVAAVEALIDKRLASEE